MLHILRKGSAAAARGPLAEFHAAFCKAFQGVLDSLVRVRPEYRIGGPREQSSWLDVLEGMRNHLAHSVNNPDDNFCEQDRQEYGPCLDVLVDSFSFLAEYKYYARDPAGDGDSAVLHQGPVPGDPRAHPGIFEDSTAVLVTPGGVAIQLAPFVLADSGGRSLLLFDGYDLKEVEPGPDDVVCYQSSQGRRFLSGAITGEVRAALVKHGVDLRLQVERIKPWSLAKLFCEVTSLSLREVEQSYRLELFVDRPDLTEPLLRFASTPRAPGGPVAMLLAGLAGAGKSALMARLATELLRTQPKHDPQHHGILLIRGEKLVAEPGVREVLFANLKRLLQAVGDKVTTFAELLAGLESNRKADTGRLPHRSFVLLFDGVNEAQRAELVYHELLQLIVASRPYPWLRIVAAIREEFLVRLRERLAGTETDPLGVSRHLFLQPTDSRYRHDANLPVWVVPPITAAERRGIYERYQEMHRTDPEGVCACVSPWGELHPDIREKIFIRPLFIRMWMEEFNGRPAGDIHSVTALFVKYLDGLRGRLPGVTERALPAVVAYMLKVGRPVLYDDDAERAGINPEGKPFLEVLVDAGLFVRQVTLAGSLACYRAFHERMAEAFAARYIWERTLEPADGGVSGRRHEKLTERNMEWWDALPRTQFLIRGLEIFIRRLIDEQDPQNAARALEHIDFQLSPNNSWLFLAGHVAQSVEFRKEIEGRIGHATGEQQNLYELALGYIRLGKHEQAQSHFARLRATAPPRQLLAASWMYESLCWRSRRRWYEAKRCLKLARVLAAGTRLQGNVLGHMAHVRFDRLRDAESRYSLRRLWYAVCPGARRRELRRISQLFVRAKRLNLDETPSDQRSGVYWETMLANFYLDTGEASRAIEVLRVAWERCLQSGLDARCRLEIHAALGRAYSAVDGPWSLAREELEKGKALAIEIGDVEMEELIGKQLKALAQGKE